MTFKKTLASTLSAKPVMPGVHLVWLESPEIAAAALPGQFVMVGCGEDCLLRRPLGVHRVEGSKVAFLFNVVGKGTEWLARRKPGDMVDLLGPMGNGFTVDPAARNLLLVAGGIGIAPLRFLADRSVEQGRKVKLIVGMATGDQLQCILAERVAPTGVDISGAAQAGADRVEFKCNVVPGVANDALLAEDVAEADQVLACGPVPMYIDMHLRRRQLLGDKPVQVSLEVRMGCGMGVCYGCSVKTSQGMKEVCKDGPVFDLDEVDWDWLGR